MAKKIIIYEKGDVVGHPTFGRGTVLEGQTIKNGKTDELTVQFNVSGRRNVNPQSIFPLWGQKSGYLAEPLRIILSHPEAMRLYNATIKLHPRTDLETVNTADELMDRLGCGRSSMGIDWKLLDIEQQALLSEEKESEGSEDFVIMVADKEVYPPIFRIGGC